jgi:hypothetical protein
MLQVFYLPAVVMVFVGVCGPFISRANPVNYNYRPSLTFALSWFTMSSSIRYEKTQDLSCPELLDWFGTTMLSEET